MSQAHTPAPWEEPTRLKRVMVNRALTWRRAQLTLPPAQHSEYADAMSGWLQDFVQTVRWPERKHPYDRER
ncbi:MAG TPA: hypothetical protein GX400_12850 [Chloroflexi bacterium]|nr:hypothetical protein [Chloroflexota bacterium]